MPHSIFSITALLLVLGSLAHGEEHPVSYSKEIRPIFSANCFKCHGPDDAQDDQGKSLRKAGLRLDVSDGQNWDEVIARITSDDSEDIMPPPEANKTLTPEQIDLLKKWIAQGAKYEKHWAFVQPRKSSPPANTHPIDHLFQEDLAGKADPYTLIRRVHLDLIGLPPSIEVADKFAANPSSEAFAQIVDKLLASPRYGERWARRWLDLARYADTNGYEKDRNRSIWPYRDYVIKSLNADKPFDQFTIEQIAGDMLPNATPEQIIATGFHRNTMLNEEGGIDPLEFRYHAMVDRVATTGTTWLGLTTGCAQCHTHKYDPITHHDYFGMMAYLDNTDEPDYHIPDPSLEERQKANLAKAGKLLSELSSRWSKLPSKANFSSAPITKVTTRSAEAEIKNNTVHLAQPTSEKEVYSITIETKQANISALRLETLTLDGQGPGHTKHGNFVLSEVEVTAAPLDGSTSPKKIDLVSAKASTEQNRFPAAHAIDGNPATGWAIHDPKKPSHQNQNIEFYFAPLKEPSPSGTRFTIKLVQNYGNQHTIANFRFSLGTAVTEVSSNDDGGLEQAYQLWLAQQKPNLVDWQPLTPSKAEANIPYLTLEEDSVIFVAGDISKHDIFTLDFPASDQPIHSLRLEALPDPRLPNNGPGMTYYEGRKGDFFLSEFQIKTNKALTFSGSSQSAFSAQYSGNADASTAIDGDIQTGWSLKQKTGQRQLAVFNLSEAIPTGTPFKVTMHFGRHFASTLGKFRLSSSDQPKVKAIAHNGTFQEFLLHAPELKAHSDKIRALQKPLQGTPTLVMKERPAAHTRPTLLRHRGEFTQPKERVEPRLPAAIFPEPSNFPKDRLAFARWLVSKENPLTARVIVNRHWAAFFREGIVPTLDDFGMQGQLPTNQALLDHLAVSLMENGWSLKKLHRLIVTSQAYQQTSVIESGTSKQFLRQRLEAEIIRDSALQASNLLNEKMFGSPVRPPQPANVSEVAYGSPKWNASTGTDRFRRSIYTYQKRTAPFAFLTTFDAGSGEACLAKRDRSNTPLQALTLMNDPMFIEIANHFGQELEKREGTPAEKITYAFRQLLTRPPTDDEVQLLSKFFQKHQSWPTITRALLSLDEAVTKN
ncbi:MAG: PSD1 and planctomycete cytochrome C domain-containing protein [Akkermansiaceae bacterium]